MKKKYYTSIGSIKPYLKEINQKNRWFPLLILDLCLDGNGLLLCDMENSHLKSGGHTRNVDRRPGVGHLVCYRIAMGLHTGRKAFTLQTLLGRDDEAGGPDKLAKMSGFSLHPGVEVKAAQKRKLEKICRYITRPAMSVERLPLKELESIKENSSFSSVSVNQTCEFSGWFLLDREFILPILDPIFLFFTTHFDDYLWIVTALCSTWWCIYPPR